VNTKRGWLGVALLATLLIFSVLTLVAWDFVREVIVIPLTYLFWLGGLILNSIPQEVYLIGLIIIAGIIALNTLSKLQRKTSNQRFTQAGLGDASRYRLWLRLYAAAPTGEYPRLELARETRRLILSLLAYQEGLTLAEVEQKIVSGDLAVPVIIKQFIHDRDFTFTLPPRQRFWQRFNRKADRQSDPLLKQSLEEIVQFIETRLEIVHDGNSFAALN
jgi:hypothetical protein